MRHKILLILMCWHLLGFAYETLVESDEARYDGSVITLLGHVSLENTMGKMTAEQAILKKDIEKQTKIDFPWIEVKKNVFLTLSEGGSLSCETVILDYTKMTSLFLGHPQVYFRDKIGEIYADRARVDYIEKEGGGLKANLIILYDNVRLINLGSPEKPASQYALADKVVYDPNQQLVILEGIDQNRVLFFDKLRDMQISAKTVHAKRNPETQTDSIEGKGDVRFVFGQQELNKIKQRFQLQ